MTGVPLSYTPEPGYIRCGNSFEKNLTVTGELPGRNGYGANEKKFIPYIAKVPAGSWWSRKTPQEAAFRTQILSRLASTQDEMGENLGSINASQQEAIEWLFALARGNLERVDQIYTFWTGYGEHPETGTTLPADNNVPSPIGAGTYRRPSEWPLTASDAIYLYISECQGQSARWVDDRELGLDGNVRHVRYYFCPGQGTRDQRARDRAQILELLLDAARAVRCAQYGVWRIVLYQRALADWNEQHGDLPSFAPGGAPTPTPTPGLQGAGGFVWRPVEPIDPGRPGDQGGAGVQPGGVRPQEGIGSIDAVLPPTPPDWPTPTPDDLPDPGPLGGGPGGGTQIDEGMTTSTAKRWAPLMVAGAALVAYHLATAGKKGTLASF